MPRIDVRRLAAVDMHGVRGTRRRAVLITVEFIVGALLCTGLGVLIVMTASGAQAVFAVWLIGIGLNYIPLAVHVLALWRPGALGAELTSVDIMAELRHYTTAQLWVFVPGLFVVLALIQARQRKRSSR